MLSLAYVLFALCPYFFFTCALGSSQKGKKRRICLLTSYSARTLFLLLHSMSVTTAWKKGAVRIILTLLPSPKLLPPIPLASDGTQWLPVTSNGYIQIVCESGYILQKVRRGDGRLGCVRPWLTHIALRHTQQLSSSSNSTCH